MRRIRSKDTIPELKVRRLAHSMGYRYRLHYTGLPGKPDLVFQKKRKVIFVHGCFWHQHTDCVDGKVPASNRSYWEPKLRSNVERDAKAQSQLRRDGWDVLVVWECETKNAQCLAETLKKFLD